MPTSLSPAHLLSEIFRLQIEEVSRLHELLKEEYQVLQSTSPDLLERLTERKQRQIEKLEASVAQQNHLLQQRELPPSRQGMETFLQTYSTDHPLRQQWLLLEQALTTCQKQNAINGGLLIKNRRHVGDALDLLRGVAHEHKTYGSSGETHPSQSGKFLGSA